jgi:hypothetical protein
LVTERAKVRHGKGIKRYEADRWLSECVRHANPICQYCQRRESVDCAHIYGRRHIAVRWDKENVLALCRHCHKDTAENPMAFADFIDSVFPGRRQRLAVKMRGFLKNSAFTRAQASAHYRGEYRKMVRDGTREFAPW